MLLLCLGKLYSKDFSLMCDLTYVSLNPDRNGVGGQNQRKDDVSYYTDEKVQPFHYSSSIYYGGQDVYSRPETAQNPGTSVSNHTHYLN